VLNTQYILGLATVGDRMLIHVDVEKLMGSRDMALVPDAAESD
ncbi:MAG: chemotaxis protein CheW, partial [Burkholderiales bacterium]|nr:chemotaxis protein CheW [Burkholderiales bacterium]